MNLVNPLHRESLITYALEPVWLVRPWLDHFFQLLAQLGAIYAHLVCVLVPKLNSGRLAVVV